MHHIPSEKLAELKDKLLAQKARLTEGLSTITRQNPDDHDDWTAKTDEAEGGMPDKNDQADAIEDLEENIAIATPLESQLKDVEEALARIDAGTYGHDETTGEPIPVERLEANPAARTNI
jgi:RNA polymerase-binding transcription factor DksA